MADRSGRSAPADRREARGTPAGQLGGPWPTAITRVAPNSILVRGYPVDEMIGRLGFSEGIYLILRGELPSPTIGRLFSAILLSSIDHGVTPPSTLAARNTATAGAPLASCIAAGVLASGTHRGEDIESSMRFLENGLRRHAGGQRMEDVARGLVLESLEAGHPPSGFGHRLHTRDPRAIRLVQMAIELELDGGHVALALAVERALAARPDAAHTPMALNVHGAIAAVASDLGFPPELGNALFIIARVPGLVAHVYEEGQRQPRMRQIDPKDHHYDGPPTRRLPETRK